RTLRGPRRRQGGIGRGRGLPAAAHRGAGAEVPLVGDVLARAGDVEADVVGRVRRERLLRDDDLVVVLELLRRVVDGKARAVPRDDLSRAHLDVLSTRVDDHDWIADRA